MDTLLGLSFEDNPLTEILKEFRACRPLRHAQFIMREIKPIPKDTLNSETLHLWILCADSVRRFRARHWSFVKEYILKWSRHPKATGGSPIRSWLPNQLAATANAIIEASKQCDSNGIVEIRKQAEATLDDLERFFALTNHSGPNK